MTQQPRRIIDYAEENGLVPFAARRDHLERAVVRINMPERSDVVGLVTAHLTLHQARLRALDARGAPCTQTPAFVEPLRFQEPADRRVRGNGSEFRPLLGECPQVHMVKGNTPAHMASVLGTQRLADREAQRALSA